MDSPISPAGYVPQTSEEILRQIRECDTEIAKCNIALAQGAAGIFNRPPLEKEFLSGETFPIVQQQLKSEDFIPWILRQPDDRKLNMAEASFFPNESIFPNESERCGCLLVQWAQDNGWNKKISAGFCQVEVQKNETEWETCYLSAEQGGSLIHRLYARQEMTFGEVKKFL